MLITLLTIDPRTNIKENIFVETTEIVMIRHNTTILKESAEHIDQQYSEVQVRGCGSYIVVGSPQEIRRKCGKKDLLFG
jgi:hypothetical protein